MGPRQGAQMNSRQRLRARDALYQHLLVPPRDITQLPPSEAFYNLLEEGNPIYIQTVRKLSGIAGYQPGQADDHAISEFIAQGVADLNQMFWRGTWTPADVETLDNILLQGYAGRTPGGQPRDKKPFKAVYSLGKQFNAA